MDPVNGGGGSRAIATVTKILRVVGKESVSGEAEID